MLQIEADPEAVMAELAGKGVIFEDYKTSSQKLFDTLDGSRDHTFFNNLTKSVERHHLDDEFVIESLQFNYYREGNKEMHMTLSESWIKKEE